MKILCVLNAENGLWEPAYPEEVAAYEKVEAILDGMTEEAEEEFWDYLGMGTEFAAKFLGVPVETVRLWMQVDD